MNLLYSFKILGVLALKSDFYSYWQCQMRSHGAFILTNCVLSQGLSHRCSTNTVLQRCTRDKVAARPLQACLESLSQPIRRQHPAALPSHRHRAYRNSSRYLPTAKPVTEGWIQCSGRPHSLLLLQVTIQVQDVELGGGAQRPGSFLSTPGGHRVLGKQLSADNAETHRWPLWTASQRAPWWLPTLPNGLLQCLLLQPYNFFLFSLRQIWLLKNCNYSVLLWI